MKRLACVLIVALLAGGCSRTPSKIVLTAADVHPEGYPTVEGLKYLARRVAELTDGRITLDIYPGGVLGGETETIEQARLGAIDIVRTSCSPLTQFYPEMGVYSLPYLFRDSGHAWRVLEGEVGEELLSGLSTAGLFGLCYYDAGARSFYTSTRQVKSLADLAGLKIRVQENEIMVGLVETLGASATPMSFEEVYSALQTGVIDGAENNPPSYAETAHYEVAKYYTLDEHTRVPEVVAINLVRWNALSAEEKALLKQAAMESAEYQRGLWEKREREALETVKAKGSVVFVPDKAEFQAAVAPLYERYGALAPLVERIRAVE